MTTIQIVAWLTVVGVPVLVILAIIYGAWRYLKKEEVEQADYPQRRSVFEFDEEYPGETRADEFTYHANIRVYRIYRSVDRKNWVECDPVLTERAACNYAAYIKANNPKEYVRCEDPEGFILFYE